MQIAEKNLSRLLEVCNRLRPFQVQDATTIDGLSDCRGIIAKILVVIVQFRGNTIIF